MDFSDKKRCGDVVIERTLEEGIVFTHLEKNSTAIWSLLIRSKFKER
ncbi:MAG: hypothetical protein JSR80_07185 [Verrucomicrobia bacterium]|nr:hypothetical protein [Verrucomicrobiota bacterium]